MGYVLADQIRARVLPLGGAEKAALEALASFAGEDGSSVFPGDRLLGLVLSRSESHAERMQARLAGLLWLLDDGWRGHVKVRRIAVERIEDYPLAVDVVREGRDANDRQRAGRKTRTTGSVPVVQCCDQVGTTGSVPSTTGSVPPEAVRTGEESVSSLCELLASEIHRHSPKAKPAVSSPTWRDDMRKLLDLDGRTVDEIRAVIVHAQRDPFWQSRALRPAKVRQHFDTIASQMRSGSGKPKPLTADDFTAEQEAAAMAQMHATLSGTAKRRAGSGADGGAS